MQSEQFIFDLQKMKTLSHILNANGISLFEYLPETETLILYDENLQETQRIPDYLTYLEHSTRVFPDDRKLVQEFYRGNHKGPVELRAMEPDGSLSRKILESMLMTHDGQEVLLVSSRDITVEKTREELLKTQASRDPLTNLYNKTSGKELITEYLTQKNPYASCGMMIIDIDYFKNVNDTYGHLFGDLVLVEISRLFIKLFDYKDIVMRAGGDEFVVLLKDISHSVLVKKAMLLTKSVRQLRFHESDYSISCSVGVCFLPENVSSYTYEQLFENADWALYRAKEKGRNRYEFCDTLKRFALSDGEPSEASQPDIDARYLRNDIVATAFEIFEKNNSFESALELLLKVIGFRFQLDRITIVRTDIKGQTAGSQYQWRAPNTPEVLKEPGSFTKEDFLTLFHSYDEYGTTVLQHDNLQMYSEGAARLLMQGGAKTVVYAAMYNEGTYTGAISYVTCHEKRFWSRQNCLQFGELTKIIAAHIARNQALNTAHQGIAASPEYDSLTGLISFSRFREEVERIIVGGYATSHILIYTDFEDFKFFNRKYGYSAGDQLLKEFCNHIIGTMKNESEVYFTRVFADQFVLFMPYTEIDKAEEVIQSINDSMLRHLQTLFPDAVLRLRSGVYHIAPQCTSASEAIDAANYARRHVKNQLGRGVRLYDDALRKLRSLESEISSTLAFDNNRELFQIFLQPKYSLKDLSIVGAEALVRLKLEDGTLCTPDTFIQRFEKNGKIIDLDFYVLEQVVAFLAKNNQLGRRQVPISVNASSLHSRCSDTVSRGCEILKKYDVSPDLIRYELTETATILDYQNVSRLLTNLQKAGIQTVLDNFGATSTVLNTIIEMPVTFVKIDCDFFQTCTSSSRGIQFLTQLISLIKGMGHTVICRGVETEEQLEILRNTDCDLVQGYYLARPMPLDEYEALMYPSDTEA